MMFDAVIFDCDGVLVDSEILGLEESAQYLQRFGLNWSAADLVRQFTGFRDDVFEATLREAYRAANGEDPAPEFFEGLIDERRNRRNDLAPVAGAAAALSSIKQPIAVASSSRTPFLEAKLKRTNLWSLVDPHVYSADRVPHGKPAPDIFLYAAGKLGVSPEKCLVVEDSVNGVKAGAAAGMTVWGFIGGGHCFDGHGESLRSAGSERIIENFSALVSAL